MKKSFIYILIFLNLSFLFADSYITINNQTISLDTSIKEIQGLFGIQKEFHTFAVRIFDLGKRG